MNVNPMILGLQDVTGYPVAQDIFKGKADKWIVFTYEDERGALFADDKEIIEGAVLQVTLYTPVQYNYFADKKKIKKYLIENGFQVEYIKSWVETKEQVGTEEIRHTLFQININMMNEEEE